MLFNSQENGLASILISVPRRDLTYGESADAYSLTDFSRLVTELSKNGVHAIDLTTPYLENKEKGKYFKTDTHWTASGAAVAVDETVNYLIAQNILQDSIQIATGIRNQ